MTQALTFDDVWKMFQETDRKFQETDRKFQETDRKFQETDRKFQEMVREDRERRVELDRKFQETSAQIKETEVQVRETSTQLKETEVQVKETEAQVKETSAQLKETDRKVKEVSVQIGRLGGRWGEFVEGMVAPACETLFVVKGIPVHMVSRRMRSKLPGGRHMEIDVFVENTDAVVLVEVKSSLTVEDIREHIVRLAEFKEFFPRYADMRVLGAVAGIVIEEHADRFAMNNGLFVMVQAGDSMRLANDEAFVPRAW
ncbi:MAG: DUF3782 protein [Magnetococcales bacterium]|nr:DUF3782 protein [Magnetococcales bacterium]